MPNNLFQHHSLYCECRPAITEVIIAKPRQSRQSERRAESRSVDQWKVIPLRDHQRRNGREGKNRNQFAFIFFFKHLRSKKASTMSPMLVFPSTPIRRVESSKSLLRALQILTNSIQLPFMPQQTESREEPSP